MDEQFKKDITALVNSAFQTSDKEMEAYRKVMLRAMTSAGPRDGFGAIGFTTLASRIHELATISAILAIIGRSRGVDPTEVGNAYREILLEQLEHHLLNEASKLRGDKK